MSSPPVSKHTPLPTSVTRGASSAPQRRSMSRGCRASDAARPTAWICGYPPPGLDSSASPSIVDTVADVEAASVRAHASSSAGPMSDAGMLIRSRQRNVALSAIPVAAASHSAGTARAANCGFSSAFSRAATPLHAVNA